MDPFFLLPETNFLVKVELKHVNAVLRRPVDRPVFTGLKVLDTLVPIGRGQRELIIGDRSTGKTSVALDVMQAQGLLGETGADMPVSIYVGVGQKASSILQS
jgi:F-type H+-transporting ATPase subunit alpha